MGLRLMDPMMDPRPEDLEEFSIFIHSGSSREAEPEEEDAEEIKIYTRALSGYELEKVGNKEGLGNRAQRRANGPGQPKADISNDGTVSLETLAKVVVRMDPMPELPDGTIVEKITLDIIRGLPDWAIMRITEHIKWVRRKSEEREKN